jgi:hypothetical protein
MGGMVGILGDLFVGGRGIWLSLGMGIGGRENFLEKVLQKG